MSIYLLNILYQVHRVSFYVGDYYYFEKTKVTKNLSLSEIIQYIKKIQQNKNLKFKMVLLKNSEFERLQKN